MIRGLLIASAAVALPVAAQAQYIGGNAPPPPAAPVPGYAESPHAALARYVRLLAIDPRNYQALVGAGKAALDTGDVEAAAGFYGRAEEVHPRSWVPRIGQGAALLQMMEPASALRAFAEAERLGASVPALALERGLAFDLLGQQERAQADYRLVLGGVDRDEARRRLALSLAISGKRLEALSTLDPLLARRDRAAIRARAFVLALTGDVDGARSAVSGALPGLAGTMDPFLRRLATLRPNDKAAAVHLGVMPGAAGPLAQSYPAPSYAAPSAQAPTYSAPSYSTYVAPPPAQAQPARDRLAEIDRLLRPANPATPPPQASAPATPPPSSVRIASAIPRAAAAVPARRRFWVQLASGPDPGRLPDQFRRLASRHRDVFEGLNGFVAEEPERARLLVGPFKSAEDAETFADDLASADISASQWTSAPGQAVRKLPAQ
uniref:tetratricopeptide repeat protein n=1 Tax=uncultured Sphingomonas sp. TaxID=158754 RepID=UPI0025D596B1|nr:SPOR domain-containing protein [uncultured Sphingomonas sp.]